MKQILIVSFLIVICFSSLNGQIQFGIKGGWTGSWIDFEEKEMVMGFHFGGLTKIPLTTTLDLQPEILYSTRGVVLPEYFFPFDLSIDLGYLSIPVLINYKPSQKLSLQLGPEFNALLVAKIESIGESRSTEPYEKIELGLAGGFAFELFKNFNFSGRYIYGITPAFELFFTDVNGQSLGGSGKRKNRCIQLGFNYMLPLHQ